MKKIVFLIAIILFVVFVAAENFPNYQDKYVNDFSGILDSESYKTLINLFRIVDTETSAEVVFVSLGSINGSDIGDYATKLAENWGVGKNDRDNGILILYVKDIGKIWVATGYGVEGILPDSKVGRLLDEYYVPARDSGELSKGIVDFSFALGQVLEDNKEEIISGNAVGEGITVEEIIILFIILIIVIKIISMIVRRTGASGIWWLPLFIPRRGSGRGYSGGGGGFGGGGFGGGGAGR